MFIKVVFSAFGQRPFNRLPLYGLQVQDGNRAQLVTVFRFAGGTSARPGERKQVKHPAVQSAMRNFFVSQPRLAKVNTDTVKHVCSQSDITKVSARLKIIVRGAVQGVGFRPFIYRLANGAGLKGWVNNSAAGVFIEVEGPRADLEAFQFRLEEEKPPRS